MQGLYLSINNTFSVALKSDTSFDFSEKDLLLLKGHVPGIELLKEEPGKIDFSLEHIQSGEKKTLEEDGKLIIHDTWSKGLPDDVTHILYGISRRLYLSAFQYPVHGACIALPEKNILVVGHSGAGKTSVTLELLRDSQINIFSGNKTVVEFQSETLRAVAGTPTITVRESDFELFKEVEKEQEYEHWGRHTFLLPQHRYKNDDKLVIDAIAIVKLTSFKQSCEKQTYPSVVHSLYPYFIDSVNADIVLADFGKVFSGDTVTERKDTLVKNLSAVSRDIPVYFVTGTVDYIANKLKEI